MFLSSSRADVICVSSITTVTDFLFSYVTTVHTDENRDMLLMDFVQLVVNQKS